MFQLLVGERARLVEDRLADADAADVAQPPGEAYLLYGLGGQAQLGRDRRRQIRDATGLAAIVRFLGLHRRDE